MGYSQFHFHVAFLVSPTKYLLIDQLLFRTIVNSLLLKIGFSAKSQGASAQAGFLF